MKFLLQIQISVSQLDKVYTGNIIFNINKYGAKSHDFPGLFVTIRVWSELAFEVQEALNASNCHFATKRSLSPHLPYECYLKTFHYKNQADTIGTLNVIFGYDLFYHIFTKRITFIYNQFSWVG